MFIIYNIVSFVQLFVDPPAWMEEHVMETEDVNVPLNTQVQHAQYVCMILCYIFKECQNLDFLYSNSSLHENKNRKLCILKFEVFLKKTFFLFHVHVLTWWDNWNMILFCFLTIVNIITCLSSQKHSIKTTENGYIQDINIQLVSINIFVDFMSWFWVSFKFSNPCTFFKYLL